MTRCSEQRYARPRGTARQNRWPEVELANQAGEHVCVQDRFRLAAQSNVGCAAVWPIPDERAEAARCQRFGQLAHARVVLRETPARGNGDCPAGANQLVVYSNTVNFRASHLQLPPT